MVYKKKKRSALNDRSVIRKKKQGEIPIVQIETEEYQEKVEEIYGYLKDGMRANEVFAMLVLRDETLTEGKFMKLFNHALEYANVAIHRDRDYTFQLHMDRYEKIYEGSINMQDIWHRQLDPKNGAHWQTIVVKYMQAMEALEKKEKLLGLHDKKFVLEYNDRSATIVTNKLETRGSDSIPGYDFTKLDLKEKTELLSLVKECRTVPVEGVQRVIIKKKIIEINPNTGDRKVGEEQQTIDISHQVMPANVVKRMQNIKEKEPEKIIPVPDVLDSRPKGLPKSKTAEEVKNNMDLSILEELRNKLKKR